MIERASDRGEIPRHELLRARVLLAAGDGPGLEAMFATARVARDAWLEAMEPSGE